MIEKNDETDLDYPVTVKAKEYKALKMRRPKVKDQLAAEKAGVTQAERETVLFANLCDVSPEVIGELDMKDYEKLQGRYEGFLA
ncbi:MAG: phage tail assembly protein [Candidatus Thiodiazotropha taylori]|nr:phage tail assembly protein [Candidatus Thiodiazotropha taylori]